ncbi:MAG: hypothetical protein Harvfovirus10_31 [Harvfovirus sp.]|uniref:Uncharacterized protein n=1 Tax=Harvfovirus sp. TaxID=2487768 RepID=A0A3G5A533_9VIRU|nr:MAG: hypothetical protein Harvfovirus10_31 [Harvfovirus sp.]
MKMNKKAEDETARDGGAHGVNYGARGSSLSHNEYKSFETK